MKSAKPVLLLFAALMLRVVCAPPIAQAAEIIVSQTDPNCSSTSTPACYTTIQDAIDAAYAAGASDTVLVEPGSYSETITLNGVTIHGRETARTILYSSVTASTGSSSIYNMTFANQTVAIDVPSSATLSISNNIFWGNTTAVQVAASSSATIVNNVFYANGTAVYSDVDVEITNNIFMSNSASISTGSLSSFTKLYYNDFYSNSDNSTWSATDHYISTDPLFVNVSTADFHLLSGSPCKNTGSPNYPNVFNSATYDRGAYGGDRSDTIPTMVSGIAYTTTSDSISLTWSANTSYLVSGYDVYYGNTSGVYTGTGAREGASPIPVTGTSKTLSGISSATVIPAIPVLDQPTVSNQTLTLSWTAVSGATGYRVYYDVDDGTSSPPTTMIDVGDVTSYSLTGLTNNTNYKVALTAVSQTTYYVAITSLNTGAGPFTPGESYESAYSQEISVGVGTTKESGLSNIIIDYPETLVAYPNLPAMHKGCFIATAAYGYYSAPEVQALRDFRDRFLLTNGPGSAFVAWYYKHGPVAAAYLSAHPGYKPMVRAALMPAVGAAIFMTRTTFLTKGAVLLLLGIVTGLFIVRNKIGFFGGRR